MMKNSFYISFGVWLIAVSLLGVPIMWRDALVMLSGLFLVLVSFGPTILKKLQAKTKPKIKKNNPLNPPYIKGEGEEKLDVVSKENNLESPS